MRERFLRALPALSFAVVGVGVSIWIQTLHAELSRDITYTSFCNISTTINCDAVLTSPYAYLGGVTVAIWGILFYLGTVGMVVASVFVEPQRRREIAANAAVGLGILGLLFSAYMAVVAFFILNTVCLMCTALYLVSIGYFAGAWRLRPAPIARRRGGAQVSPKRMAQDRRVLIGCVVAGAALIAFGAWEAVGGRSVRLDAEGIRRENPDLYAWFQARPVLEVGPGGHSRGPADAAVTLVEFSDFDCPHCARLDETITRLMRSKRLDVRVVFRHFPLNAQCNPAAQGTRHPAACDAATAAECAGEQGRFWQYQHILFSRQGRFQRADLLGYARDLGLEPAAFERCMDSGEARARVESDAREGARLGVQSTPTIFINGRRIEGAPKEDVLLDALTLARENTAARHP